MVFYLHVIHEDSRCPRGMFYSFYDDFLFMEELKCKLGDWYKPDYSIRARCPTTGLYKLIVDEFNFCAAVEFKLSENCSDKSTMDLFINGAELKK